MSDQDWRDKVRKTEENVLKLQAKVKDNEDKENEEQFQAFIEAERKKQVCRPVRKMQDWWEEHRHHRSNSVPPPEPTTVGISPAPPSEIQRPQTKPRRHTLTTFFRRGGSSGQGKI